MIHKTTKGITVDVQNAVDMIQKNNQCFCFVYKDGSTVQKLFDEINAGYKTVCAFSIEESVGENVDVTNLTTEEVEERTIQTIIMSTNKKITDLDQLMQQAEIFVIINFERHKIEKLFDVNKSINKSTKNIKLFNGKQVIFMVSKTHLEEEKEARAIIGTCSLFASPTFLKTDPDIYDLVD